jgi:hypothetical protein
MLLIFDSSTKKQNKSAEFQVYEKHDLCHVYVIIQTNENFSHTARFFLLGWKFQPRVDSFVVPWLFAGFEHNVFGFLSSFSTVFFHPVYFGCS